MSEQWDDDRLALVLRSVGTHLLVGDEAPAGDVVRLEGHRTRRGGARVLLVAMVAAAVVVAVLAVAPVRQAVSDWLGIGSTAVKTTAGPVPTSLPAFLDGTSAITPVEAVERLGRPLPTVGELGPPDAVLAPPEGGVVLAWGDGQVSLWLHRNPEAPVLVKKLLNAGDHVARVGGLGDAALWIGGAHVFESPVRRVQAASTVLWVAGDDEYRLEADLPRDDLVRIARSADG